VGDECLHVSSHVHAALASVHRRTVLLQLLIAPALRIPPWHASALWLLHVHILAAAVAAAAGELLKKGPGQYRVTGITVTSSQQQPADSGVAGGSTAVGGLPPVPRNRQQQQRKRPLQSQQQQYSQQYNQQCSIS
jgi:hypothetical protein